MQAESVASTSFLQSKLGGSSKKSSAPAKNSRARPCWRAPVASVGAHGRGQRQAEVEKADEDEGDAGNVFERMKVRKRRRRALSLSTFPSWSLSFCLSLSRPLPSLSNVLQRVKVWKRNAEKKENKAWEQAIVSLEENGMEVFDFICTARLAFEARARTLAHTHTRTRTRTRTHTRTRACEHGLT